MRIFAISDLHLGFGVNKPMDIFGEHWKNHPERIKEAWKEKVSADDLVLVPGDISWGMNMKEAAEDMAFIHDLPGTKVVLKGNHDYWWSSLKKVREFLPDSIIPLQNTAITFDRVGIAGSRLWLDPSLNLETVTQKDEKIFSREINRLLISLKDLPSDLDTRICMTHYPPIGLDGCPGKALSLLDEYPCDIWVFGHMHLGGLDYTGFNRTIKGTRFEFVSADYLGFCPRLILDL